MFLVIYKSFQINEYVKKLFFSPSVKSVKNRLHTFFFAKRKCSHYYDKSFINSASRARKIIQVLLIGNLIGKLKIMLNRVRCPSFFCP